MSIEITLSYEGSQANENLLDFYDASTALIGFQRSLALTAHLAVNGEIITQSPSLKNASILIRPPEDGSWKAVAVVGGLLFAGGQSSHDSVVGHVFTSIYDYVISESLGFHVDFDKTLGVSIEEAQRQTDAVPKELDSGKIDALIEKTENAFKQMHRPIIESKTANTAIVWLSSKGG
jgi:hypothetical protein